MYPGYKLYEHISYNELPNISVILCFDEVEANNMGLISADLSLQLLTIAQELNKENRCGM